MRTLPVGSEIRVSKSFKAEETDVSSSKIEDKKLEVGIKPGQLVTSALALAALVGSGVALAKCHKAPKEEAAAKTKDEVTTLIKNLEEKLNNLEKNNKSEDLTGIKDDIDKLKNDLSDKCDSFLTNWLKSLETRIDGLKGQVQAVETTAHSGASEKGMINIDGLTLMQNMMTDEAIPISKEMRKYLQNISSKFQKKEIPLKPLRKGDAVWSISTETKWRGTGGQGEIFTQQAKNFKEVGVTEYEILGGNQISGLGGINGINGEYTCKYKDTQVKLEKVMSYPIDVFHNGRHSMETVTIYQGTDPLSKQPMLIFDNPKYFNSNQFIYGNSTGGITERERAVFLGKASDKLAKFLYDEKYLSNYEIYNSELLNSIKANSPKAIYLHDAAAAPYIIMARLKAPLEAANKELSKEAAEAVSTMNIVAKFHNFDYRGEAYGAERSDILNTALDKYAADIYRYAETGFGQDGMHDIEKVMVSNGGTNFDNWILSLAHDGENVSHTDLLERVEGRMDQGRRTGSLLHILQERYEAGSIHGHGNAWDRSANEVSTENLRAFDDKINSDKFKIFNLEFKNIEGCLTPEDKALLKDCKKDIDKFETTLVILKAKDNPEVKAFLEKIDKEGITNLRHYHPYVYTDSDEVIMNARRQNKMLFIEQLRSMIKYNKDHANEGNEKLFKLEVPNNLDLDSINIDNIDDVMIASFGARLVDQKNIPLLKKALKEFHGEFTQKYPGKKLITVVGGPDDTATKGFHKMLSEKFGNNISQLEFTPNPIYQSASDFTLRTSEFEPDGDLAESLYKGTPVIVTKVGGYVDRIFGTNKGLIAKRTPAEVAESGENILSGMTNDYKELLHEGANIYFNDKPRYQRMVRDAINSEYSWIVKNSDNKITRDCGVARDLKLLGFDLNTFPNFAHA